MGNSATFEIRGQGKVVFKMNFGKEMTLTNVCALNPKELSVWFIAEQSWIQVRV